MSFGGWARSNPIGELKRSPYPVAVAGEEVGILELKELKGEIGERATGGRKGKKEGKGRRCCAPVKVFKSRCL